MTVTSRAFGVADAEIVTFAVICVPAPLTVGVPFTVMPVPENVTVGPA